MPNKKVYQHLIFYSHLFAESLTFHCFFLRDVEFILGLEADILGVLYMPSTKCSNCSGKKSHVFEEAVEKCATKSGEELNACIFHLYQLSGHRLINGKLSEEVF